MFLPLLLANILPLKLIVKDKIESGCLLDIEVTNLGASTILLVISACLKVSEFTEFSVGDKVLGIAGIVLEYEL